jgi:hypothetical protein
VLKKLIFCGIRNGEAGIAEKEKNNVTMFLVFFAISFQDF